MHRTASLTATGKLAPAGSPSGANAAEARLEHEETRIRAAYARRRNDDLDSCFNPGYVFMIQEREREVLRLLKRHGCADLASKRILDVGCGAGKWLAELVRWGARPTHLTGVDLLPERIAQAARRCPAGVDLRIGSAAALDFTEDSFDIVLQSLVFTSILDTEVQRRVAAEMMRVVKPGGLLIWYDYHVNNPWNPDVRGVKKRVIRQLFPRCTTELRRITLAPPLARSIAPYSHLACAMLARCPLLLTHYLGAIRTP